MIIIKITNKINFILEMEFYKALIYYFLMKVIKHFFITKLKFKKLNRKNKMLINV